MAEYDAHDDAKRPARFSVGQLVIHRMFEYRGVVVDVDANFQLSEEWYDQVASSRPPKNEPWYHVLVNNAEHATYVAQRNLGSDESGEPIRHPLLSNYFSRFVDGHYLASHALN